MIAWDPVAKRLSGASTGPGRHARNRRRAGIQAGAPIDFWPMPPRRPRAVVVTDVHTGHRGGAHQLRARRRATRRRRRRPRDRQLLRARLFAVARVPPRREVQLPPAREFTPPPLNPPPSVRRRKRSRAAASSTMRLRAVPRRPGQCGRHFPARTLSRPGVLTRAPEPAKRSPRSCSTARAPRTAWLLRA